MYAPNFRRMISPDWIILFSCIYCSPDKSYRKRNEGWACKKFYRFISKATKVINNLNT